MNKTFFAAAAALAMIPATASAQTADGSRSFGFDPYVAVMGGIEEFDRNPGSGIPDTGDNLDGVLVEGIVGANVPLGTFFVGAEGNVAKGISGDIDWQYGVSGRAGVRVGESGLFYGKAGYQWVNFDRFGPDSPDYDAPIFGLGVEAGPQDVGFRGLTGNAGPRVRLEVTTFDGESFRPMAGLVAHF